MLWAIVDVLAFILVIAGVVVLARRDTARWEREGRVVPGRAGPPVGPARRLRGAERLRARLRGTAAGAGRAARRVRSLPGAARVRLTAVRDRPRRRRPLRRGRERVSRWLRRPRGPRTAGGPPTSAGS